MRLLSSLIFLSIGLSALAVDTLPEKFYGKYKLDKSENFDEYLTAKGYNWFTRKLIAVANFEKVFAKGATPDTFDYENLTTKKNVAYKGVTLGKEFTGDGLDSTQHKITFYLKGGKLYEKHVPTGDGEAKEEEYIYSFDGEHLLVSMEASGVIGKRFYARQ